MEKYVVELTSEEQKELTQLGTERIDAVGLERQNSSSEDHSCPGFA